MSDSEGEFDFAALGNRTAHGRPDQYGYIDVEDLDPTDPYAQYTTPYLTNTGSREFHAGLADVKKMPFFVAAVLSRVRAARAVMSFGFHLGDAPLELQNVRDTRGARAMASLSTDERDALEDMDVHLASVLEVFGKQRTAEWAKAPGTAVLTAPMDLILAPPVTDSTGLLAPFIVVDLPLDDVFFHAPPSRLMKIVDSYGEGNFSHEVNMLHAHGEEVQRAGITSAAQLVAHDLERLGERVRGGKAEGSNSDGVDAELFASLATTVPDAPAVKMVTTALTLSGLVFLPSFFDKTLGAPTKAMPREAHVGGPDYPYTAVGLVDVSGVASDDLRRIGNVPNILIAATALGQSENLKYVGEMNYTALDGVPEVVADYADDAAVIRCQACGAVYLLHELSNPTIMLMNPRDDARKYVSRLSALSKLHNHSARLTKAGRLSAGAGAAGGN